MQVVILAGGFGTRISEESGIVPKPLINIGTRPILWHIMKIYAAHGLTEFVICCGYKGHLIKRYFADYVYHCSDVTFDLARNRMRFHGREPEDWKVTLVDTGEDTMTGGRLRQVRRYLGDRTFCMTYGDGVSDIDITALIDFHRSSKAAVTLTAVKQPGRFGALSLLPDGATVTGFREKNPSDYTLINGGFFVVEPEALDRIAGNDTVWEHEPLQSLAEEGKLAAYRHTGFWQNMDTLRDKNVLNEMWDEGSPPWNVWDRPARIEAAE